MSSTDKGPLAQYESMRDFSRTPEPTTGRATSRNLRFVVQKHTASRLHYDVRLEIDGVLKSWPVPKGPSLDPREKRFAAMVEDHPLDYADFEGIIPEGSYGAGEMIVWDTGVYSPDEKGVLSFGDRDEANRRMREELEAGKLSFTLKGRKMRGSWTLVHTSRGPRDWLLIKHRDRHADTEREILCEDRSVYTGLTVEDLKQGRLPSPAGPPQGSPAPFPASLKPMQARLIERPFSHPGWIFEPKLDGYRTLAYVRGGSVILKSRTGRDITAQFPEVVADLETQLDDEIVLDGEIVALGEDGLPDFEVMQRHANPVARRNLERVETAPPILYYAFDLLYLNGMSLQRLPLHERKEALLRSLVPGDSLQTIDHVEAQGEALFEAVRQTGLEGFVAKERSSTYEPSVRSRHWLKAKHTQSQEFVVGAYTQGLGERGSTFGALIIGYNSDSDLTYCGAVGSGFDRAMLEALTEELRSLETAEPPFANPEAVDEQSPRWVRPELVATVRFHRWTEDGRLRAPVFVGLRPETDPASVSRESPDAEAPKTVVPAKSLPRTRYGAGTQGGREGRHTAERPDSARSLLEQLDAGGDSLDLNVEGHRVRVTNLSKPLWPADGEHRVVTKGDMVRYYAAIAPLLLPHLADRPMTLTRYPNGIDGGSFYQKHVEDPPPFVNTVEIYSSHNEGDSSYITVDNLATLVWLAQLADIELHPWSSRTVGEPDAAHLPAVFHGSREVLESSALNYPDFIVFDLDPYIYSGREKTGDEPELNRAAFASTRTVALALRQVLDQLSLSSFIKTSGKTGLHIYVPIVRQYDYRAVRKVCETIGGFLLRQRPRDVTMEWSVEKRTGKVFFDHNQNSRGKNMASIYSLRPLPGAPVSTPVRWDELERVYPTDFTIDTVPERVEAMGDLWAGILESKHDLNRLVEAV